MSHKDFEKLKEDIYEVCIDSTLENGHLTFGEYYIKGQLSDEILISTHICHPSLCNDNLSGIAMAALLAKHLSLRPICDIHIGFYLFREPLDQLHGFL